jgi:DNA-binding beta-propeller fold protein YncE
LLACAAAIAKPAIANAQITKIISARSWFGSPYGVAVDSGGNVYVAGYHSRNVFKIAADGTITETTD